MTITDCAIYKYALKLNRPIPVRGLAIHQREGLVLQLTSDTGIQGFGEAAPLPGFSTESLVQAEAQLRALRAQLRGQEIPGHVAKLDGHFEKWLAPFGLKPSIRFGVESAVLHLLANSQKRPLHQILPGSTKHALRIIGLLTSANDDIVSQTQNLISAGFTELKLKVGGNVEQDIIAANQVATASSGKALLHVDANQQWSFDQALAFGRAIGCATVSYIEEPFKDINRVPEFFDETMIPVAVDESLQRFSVDAIRAIPGIETVVLKPTVLGGMEKAAQLMRQCEAHAINTVISSSFESSLGLWSLANLAQATARHHAAGLDTLKWFADDTFQNSVAFHHGRLPLNNRIITSADLNFNCVHQVT